MLIKNFLITSLLIAQFSTASPLTDGALRLIQVGNEIGSRDENIDFAATVDILGEDMAHELSGWEWCAESYQTKS